MRQCFLAAAGLLLICGTALAQNEGPSSPSDQGANALRNPYRSPREVSAREAIQRRAAWKAAQRQQRLEAAKWLGYAPSRPPASMMQFMGSGPEVRPGFAYFNFPGMLMPHNVIQPR